MCSAIIGRKVAYTIRFQDVIEHRVFKLCTKFVLKAMGKTMSGFINLGNVLYLTCSSFNAHF
jgi:hypothetical protein